MVTETTSGRVSAARTAHPAQGSCTPLRRSTRGRTAAASAHRMANLTKGGRPRPGCPMLPWRHDSEDEGQDGGPSQSTRRPAGRSGARPVCRSPRPQWAGRTPGGVGLRLARRIRLLDRPRLGDRLPCVRGRWPVRNGRSGRGRHLGMLEPHRRRKRPSSWRAPYDVQNE
jgi:hypothetical protein